MKENHKIGKSKDSINLEDGDGEGGSFSSTRLSLRNHVSTLDDWLDCSLLDGRRLLKTISIDAPAKYFMEEKYMIGIFCFAILT